MNNIAAKLLLRERLILAIGRHVDLVIWQQIETPYHFSNIKQLREDFLHDIKQWNFQHRDL